MWISKTGVTAKRGSAAVPSRASADTVKARITDKELDDIVAVLSQVSLAVSLAEAGRRLKVAGEGRAFSSGSARDSRETATGLWTGWRK